MHITCFHLVVTPLVCIHQEWWVFEHQVCVIQQSICVLWRQCWLCLKPFITTMDDVACSCEESFMLLESVRDGIIRVCPSESLESRNDLVSMVCAWDAFVEEGSAIDTDTLVLCVFLSMGFVSMWFNVVQMCGCEVSCGLWC